MINYNYVKKGDIVVLLNNVIEERQKIGFVGCSTTNYILKNAIDKIYKIDYFTYKWCQLEGLEDINISYKSLTKITLKDIRKLKLKKIL